MDRQTTTMP